MTTATYPIEFGAVEKILEMAQFLIAAPKPTKTDRIRPKPLTRVVSTKQIPLEELVDFASLSSLLRDDSKKFIFAALVAEPPWREGTASIKITPEIALAISRNDISLQIPHECVRIGNPHDPFTLKWDPARYRIRKAAKEFS